MQGHEGCSYGIGGEYTCTTLTARSSGRACTAMPHAYGHTHTHLSADDPVVVDIVSLALAAMNAPRNSGSVSRGLERQVASIRGDRPSRPHGWACDESDHACTLVRTVGASMQRSSGTGGDGRTVYRVAILAVLCNRSILILAVAVEGAHTNTNTSMSMSMRSPLVLHSLTRVST